MGYHFHMECYKELDSKPYLESGVRPSSKSVSNPDGSLNPDKYLCVIVYSGSRHDLFEKNYYDIAKNERPINPIRHLAETKHPDLDFDFYDTSLLRTDGRIEPSRVLYNPTGIRKVFEGLHKALWTIIEQKVELLEDIYLLEEDYEDYKYDFQNTFELCDKAIEWNQKIITGWA